MEELLKIIKDPQRVILSGIDGKYLTDSLGRIKGSAAAVVFPESTEEVSALMKYAYNNNIPVTPRGAGTNLVGSTVPHGNGIVLDLSRMNRVLEIDPQTFTATVEPGVVLGDFQRLVESKGLFYPPDPGEKTATIGGNISTNAGGMRAVKYGVTRDYVRALELVLADGSVITCGSKNVKDASGLSLKNLIIGSEGTLAIITKCILKLIPAPQKTLSAVVPFADLKTGISAVLDIIRSNAAPTALEFAERSVVELGENFTGLKFPQPKDTSQPVGAYIILTFDGTENTVTESAQIVNDTVRAAGALDFIELNDAELLADVWKIRGCLVKAVEAVSEQEPIDLVVPINRTAEFVSFVHETEEKIGVQMVAFGHAGDGNVHLCVLRGNRSEECWQRELHECMTSLYNYAYSLGGLTSGEHGIGIAKREYYFNAAQPAALDIMRSVKTVFDSRHILNDHISYLE